MATRIIHLGSKGPFRFDDADTFSGGESHGLKCNKVPADDDDVIRLVDSGGVYAPASSSYLVMALDGVLTAERRLQVGNELTLNDGGGNGDGTIEVDTSSYINRVASITTDTAPNDDTTLKRVSIQLLASPPTNAAYIAFTNSPGASTFYLVLEEG